MLYLASVLLVDWFQQCIYYDHFIDLVKLVILCLKFELMKADISAIQKGFEAWVEHKKYIHFPSYLNWTFYSSFIAQSLSLQALLSTHSIMPLHMPSNYSLSSSHSRLYRGLWPCLDILGISNGTLLWVSQALHTQLTASLHKPWCLCLCKCPSWHHQEHIQSTQCSPILTNHNQQL